MRKQSSKKWAPKLINQIAFWKSYFFILLFLLLEIFMRARAINFNSFAWNDSGQMRQLSALSTWFLNRNLPWELNTYFYYFSNCHGILFHTSFFFPRLNIVFCCQIRNEVTNNSVNRGSPLLSSLLSISNFLAFW